jgi:DNA-binding MarR family transcriptional regulator
MRQDALQQGTGDAVDRIVEQWRRERPDLDPSAKEVTGRVIRLSGIFQKAFGEAYRGLGIDESDYGILAPLRRAGAPYELTPTELARSRMLTSGGATAAIDRLERKGLVSRKPNPADRRGSLVGLTEEGVRIMDEAMTRHAEAEQALLASLGEKDRERLAALLRKVLLALEPLSG